MDDIDPEQQRVMDALAPYFDRFAPIFEDAVALYNSDVSNRARAEHDNRAALASIYRHAWMNVQRQFGEEPGCHFPRLNGLLVVNVRDEVVFRIKKVDANGRHVNADTQQQRDFDRMMPLPGLPQEAVRVVLGYQPDPAFSCVERVIVRPPRGRWQSQIVVLDDGISWVDITPAELPFRAGGRRAA